MKDNSLDDLHWERGFELGKKVRDHDDKAGLIPALNPGQKEPE